MQGDAWASIIDDGAATNRLPSSDSQGLAQTAVPQAGGVAGLLHLSLRFPESCCLGALLPGASHSVLVAYLQAGQAAA